MKTLRDITDSVVREEPDIESAIKKAVAIVKRSDALVDEIITTAVRFACQLSVYESRRSARIACQTTAKVLAKGEVGTTRYTCKAIAASFLKHYTVGNKPLGECTRVDLMDAAATFTAQAKGAHAKARFVRSLAAKLDDEQTVADVWKEAAISTLWSDLSKNVA